MLGFVAIGLTIMMVFTLVKNALKGKQLSAEDVFSGTVELLIPVTTHSNFHFAPWREALSDFKTMSGRLKIHILIDGHNPKIDQWNNLKSLFPFIEIQCFLMRPQDIDPASWMIDQMVSKVRSDVIIIGDPEIAASEVAFVSTAKIVSEKNEPYFILPQTAKLNPVNEAIAALNPTLSLTSVFGFRKFRKAISHPLMSLAQGWMAMPLNIFQEIKLQGPGFPSWKQSMSRQWDTLNKSYHLAFGEKHLKRFYETDLKLQFESLTKDWEFYWKECDRTGFWLYLVTIILWSFPIIFFYFNPFASILSAVLLILYRFFTKIVFQESWSALFLHFVGCLALLGSFGIWAFLGLKSKYKSQGLGSVS